MGGAAQGLRAYHYTARLDTPSCSGRRVVTKLQSSSSYQPHINFFAPLTPRAPLYMLGGTAMTQWRDAFGGLAPWNLCCRIPQFKRSFNCIFDVQSSGFVHVQEQSSRVLGVNRACYVLAVLDIPRHLSQKQSGLGAELRVVLSEAANSRRQGTQTSQASSDAGGTNSQPSAQQHSNGAATCDAPGGNATARPPVLAGHLPYRSVSSRGSSSPQPSS